LSLTGGVRAVGMTPSEVLVLLVPHAVNRAWLPHRLVSYFSWS
jgi:hypothetical protein